MITNLVFFSENFEELIFIVLTKKDFQIQVGRRIRELRMKKGFSQMELAYRCNFEKSNMNRIESGNTNITTYNLFIIASELEISLEHFFAGMQDINL